MPTRQLFDQPRRLFDPPRQLFAKAAARDDLEDGLVWGFASVAEKDGRPVVDQEGDVIDEAELQRAAHAFMKDRTGGVMHLRTEDGSVVKAGEIVESAVISSELQKALGI